MTKLNGPSRTQRRLGVKSKLVKSNRGRTKGVIARAVRRARRVNTQ